jgi:GNAT superfamily N-acetyltransferase
MTLELREGDFDAFFRTPFEIYGADSPYVSPMRADLARYLDPKRNPMLTGGGVLTHFTALRDGRPVGRLTAHIHPASNVRHGVNRAYFGFFDVADDPEAAALLLDRAQVFGRDHGCTELAGAFNLTAMQQIGIVTDGFDGQPYTDMVWNPPHTPRLLEANGFTPFFPMATYELELDRIDPEQLLNPKTMAILEDPAWTFAPMTRRDFAARLEDGRDCLNDGFQDNPMFVPLSAEEFTFQAGEMMWILDPALSTIAQHDGQAAGAVICIPDLNPFVKAVKGRYGFSAIFHFVRQRLRRDRAVMILYSVKRALHGQGLNAVMLMRVLRALKARGYKRCGGTWIAEENAASLRQVEKLGARRLHRLHLFKKAL